MRQPFLILTVATMLTACNNSGTTQPKSDTQIVEQLTETTNKSERQTLIEELKELGQTIASNNKEKIANIFSFPLSEKAFSINIDDSTYHVQFKSNGNTTTKAMFLNYYEDISESIWLDQINNLFKHINIDSLLYKDKIEYDNYSKTEPCYYSYKIHIDKSSLTLRMDSKSNQNYKSNKLSEENMPENSSEICEHNFWWIFEFNGKKLHLTNISGAG